MEDILEDKSAEDQETFIQKGRLISPIESNNSKRIVIPAVLSESDPEDELNEEQNQD